jgi:hypothetical protein
VPNNVLQQARGQYARPHITACTTPACPPCRLALLAKAAAAAGAGEEFEAHQRAAVDAQRLLLGRLRGEGEDEGRGGSSDSGGGAKGGGGGPAGAARERLVALLEGLAEHHLRGRQLEKVRRAWNLLLQYRRP